MLQVIRSYLPLLIGIAIAIIDLLTPVFGAEPADFASAAASYIEKAPQ